MQTSRDDFSVAPVRRPMPFVWLAMLATGIGFFCLYGLTLSPGVFPGESAALLASAMGVEPTLSPEHPLWRALVAAWQCLPFGTPVFRLNLLSVVCGALAVALTCHTTASWIRGLRCPDTATEVFPDYAPVAAGATAALLLGLSAPVWSVATRFHYLTFDLVLVLLVLELLLSYEQRGELWRLAFLAFGYGVGIVETTCLLALFPFFVVRVLLALLPRQFVGWHGEATAYVTEPDDPLRSFLVLSLAGLLGAGVYALVAWSFQETDGFVLRGYDSTFAVLRSLWRTQLLELAQLLPRQGWLFSLGIVFVPWAMVLIGARHALRDYRNTSGNVLHLLLLLPVWLVLFNVGCLPWRPLTLHGRIPLLEVLLTAQLAGYVAAYWFPRFLPRREQLRSGPTVGAAPGSGDLELRADAWNAALGLAVLGILALTFVVAAVRNGAGANGRRGVFVDAYAGTILGGMGERRWVATDGRLDHHLRILAALRRRPIHVVNLSDEQSPVQIQLLLRAIDSDPDLAALRPRLRNAACLGATAFVREWISADPRAADRLLLYELPELWAEAGLATQPNGLCFHVADSPAAAQAPLLARERRTWGELDRMLGPTGREPDALDALRLELRRHVSLVINNLGMQLEDWGNSEDAYATYERALAFTPANMSALLNRARLAREGLRPEELDEAERAANEALGVFHSTVSISQLSHTYGCVREPAAFAAQAAEWSRLDQTGLAVVCMQRAADLAPVAEKPLYQSRLAALLLEQGNILPSETIYRDLLRKDPADRTAILGLLRIAIGRQDAASGERLLAQARRMGLAGATLSAEEAAVDIAAGRLEDARRKLQALADRYPENLQLHASLAAVLIRQGNLDEVERSILPYMQYMGGKISLHPLCFQTIGMLEKAKGDGHQATARLAFRKALALRPTWRYLAEDILRLDLALHDNPAAESDACRLLRWCSANRHVRPLSPVMG